MFRNILRAIWAVILISAAIALIWNIFHCEEISLTPIKMILGIAGILFMLFMTAFVSCLDCIEIPATQLLLKK